jgi:uncharacterized protein YqjF (DUF2071 family)
MLNYRVDPRLLIPLTPSGVELDFFQSETYISIVGLLFLDTQVLTIAFPFHRNFEEVNLRFYVRRRSADTWRRGVCFVREIVPKKAVALLARLFYGERYMALPMKHFIEHRDGALSVEYSWRRDSKWESIAMSALGDPVPVLAGTHEEFITEHYWGYTSVRGGCSEYRVEHPRWRIWPADNFQVIANMATLYGDEFADMLNSPPVTAFIAEGSHVRIFGREINA